MTYATQQDLIDRFGELELMQLTDRFNVPPAAVDPVPVARALADADALCDSYIVKNYALPLASVPAVLTKQASDIARFYLYGARADKESPVAMAYREAVKWLESLARGLVTMDVGGVEPAPSGGGSVKHSAPDRVFTRSSLEGL